MICVGLLVHAVTHTVVSARNVAWRVMVPLYTPALNSSLWPSIGAISPNVIRRNILTAWIDHARVGRPRLSCDHGSSHRLHTGG